MWLIYPRKFNPNNVKNDFQYLSLIAILLQILNQIFLTDSHIHTDTGSINAIKYTNDDSKHEKA